MVGRKQLNPVDVIPEKPMIYLLGKIVRLTPNHYSFDDPDAAKIIYGSTNIFPKSRWYYAWSHPTMSNIFANRDNKRNAEDRRKQASAFSSAAVLTYEKFVEQCVVLLDSKLRDIASKGQVVNLGQWMMCYAFDIQGLITVRQYVPETSQMPIVSFGDPPC